MDLTGLLSVPSVWCAREDTNKTNFFTRTKMSGHRRNQKLQWKVNMVLAVIPTYDNAHPTNNSHEGRTSATQVKITPQQLHSNDTNMTPPPKILHKRWTATARLDLSQKYSTNRNSQGLPFRAICLRRRMRQSEDSGATSPRFGKQRDTYFTGKGDASKNRAIDNLYYNVWRKLPIQQRRGPFRRNAQALTGWPKNLVQ
jgi:hypothetical protein